MLQDHCVDVVFRSEEVFVKKGTTDSRDPRCRKRVKNLWNAKLTETRIFRELSIVIESPLIELKSSLIQLQIQSSLIQLESSLIQLESSLIQLLSSLYMYN